MSASPHGVPVWRRRREDGLKRVKIRGCMSAKRGGRGQEFAAGRLDVDMARASPQPQGEDVAIFLGTMPMPTTLESAGFGERCRRGRARIHAGHQYLHTVISNDYYSKVFPSNVLGRPEEQHRN